MTHRCDEIKESERGGLAERPPGQLGELIGPGLDLLAQFQPGGVDPAAGGQAPSFEIGQRGLEFGIGRASTAGNPISRIVEMGVVQEAGLSAGNAFGDQDGEVGVASVLA